MCRVRRVCAGQRVQNSSVFVGFRENMLVFNGTVVFGMRLHRYFSLVSPLGVAIVFSPGEFAAVAAAVGGHQPP